MTALAAPTVTPTGRAPDPARASLLAGTGTLIRFILRRDRLRLPAWLLGMTALLVFFLRALTELASTEEQRQDLRRIMGGTVGALFGPGYGREDITAERYVVGVYGLFFFVLAALMSMLLIARHTRAEERSGRAELVRSAVVGRDAHLTAALTVAAAANAGLALLLGATLAASGFDRGDGLLFGASVAAVGLVFAAVTAITVQITEYPRAATGIAGAVLGVAWALRAAGDAISEHGNALSWLSPLAWSHQTRPYVDGRWWPLLLSVGLAAALATVGYALAASRDLGAGLMAAAGGAPTAPGWLRTPLAVAFRLQRTTLLWWTVALAASGVSFAGLGEQIADPQDMSGYRRELFGGSADTLFDGYLGTITQLTVALAGIVVILGVQAVRTEESQGRAEPVLATATSRGAWLGSHLAVIAAGVVGLLLVVGLFAGIGAAGTTGDSAYLWRVTAAHLAHAPGVLVLLGIAALLFGVLPRAIGLAWVVLGYSLFIALFGAVSDVPQWLANLALAEHTGQPLLDGVSWSTVTTLLAIAAGLLAAALAGFRRRDLAPD